MSDSDTQSEKQEKERPSSQQSIDSDQFNTDTPICCNKKTCVSCCCNFNNYWKVLVALVSVLVYLGIGGAIFNAVERPNEIQSIKDAEEARAEAAADLEELRLAIIYNLTNSSNLTTEQAEFLVDGVVAAAEFLNEVSEQLPAETSGPIWDYASAVFFASTVITTVGYGSIAPSTTAGQILFIFYALIGIPIALVFLTTLGNILTTWLEYLLKPLTKHFGKDSIGARLIYFAALAIVTLIFFILIPAAIYTSIEPWNYTESVYFTFVTLTTVGFGDFVPGQSLNTSRSPANSLYKIMSSCWLWIGLALVAAIISELQNTLEASGKWAHNLHLKIIKEKHNLHLKIVKKKHKEIVEEREERKQELTNPASNSKEEEECGDGQDV